MLQYPSWQKLSPPPTGGALISWEGMKACMQEEPRVEKCPIAIQFLATYVIVVGVW